jgi:hypothetical protein
MTRVAQVRRRARLAALLLSVGLGALAGAAITHTTGLTGHDRVTSGPERFSAGLELLGHDVPAVVRRASGPDDRFSGVKPVLATGIFPAAVGALAMRWSARVEARVRLYRPLSRRAAPRGPPIRLT